MWEKIWRAIPWIGACLALRIVIRGICASATKWAREAVDMSRATCVIFYPKPILQVAWHRIPSHPISLLCFWVFFYCKTNCLSSFVGSYLAFPFPFPFPFTYTYLHPINPPSFQFSSGSAQRQRRQPRTHVPVIFVVVPVPQLHHIRNRVDPLRIGPRISAEDGRGCGHRGIAPSGGRGRGGCGGWGWGWGWGWGPLLLGGVLWVHLQSQQQLIAVGSEGAEGRAPEILRPPGGLRRIFVFRLAPSEELPRRLPLQSRHLCSSPWHWYFSFSFFLFFFFLHFSFYFLWAQPRPLQAQPHQK